MRYSLHLITACLLLLFTNISIGQESSINGIYSDGNVVLMLEEVGDEIKGLFIDVNEAEYEVTLKYDKEGLLGFVGSFNAWIPYDTEVLELYATPFDDNQQPIWDETYEYKLNYVSELEDYSSNQSSGYTWSPIHRFGRDFYPSYVLATSTMTNEVAYHAENGSYSYSGDNNGYFGISVEGLQAGTKVSVVVEGEPFIKSSMYETVLTHGGVNEIYPIIEYDFNGLKNITQAQPMNLKFALYANDQYLDSKMEVVWVRSVNDAVTSGMDHHGSIFNFEFMFAAYVNENEPSLDPILGAVLDEGIVTSWSGYQGGEEEVLQQVFAMWYHFQRKGFRYSSITTQSGSDEMSFGQTVRFIKDALVTSQANCIDGTVLFASFLYKVGIDVSIVLVPGHAYLAFRADSENGWYALETTMLGQLNLEHSVKQEQMYAVLSHQSNDIQNSWDSFLGALEIGTQHYIEEALPGIEKGDPEYMEINIAEARQRKIRPIK